MVIGGTVVDITATAHEATSMLNSSFPGTTRISLGGVGRNVAEAICKLDTNGCVFVSAVGGGKSSQDNKDSGAEGATDDLFGSWLIGEIERKGIRQLEIHPVPGARTATYTALHDATGNLVSAIADMGVFELLPPSKIRDAIVKHRPKTVCFDGNLSIGGMRAILETCNGQGVQTFFEPTSVAKCNRPLDESMLGVLLDGALDFASPNEYELQEMAISARRLISEHKDHVHLRGLADRPVTKHALHDPEDVVAMPGDNTAYKGLLLDAFSVSQFIPNLFIKLGPKGVLVFQRTNGDGAQRVAGQDVSSLGIEDWRQDGIVRWQWFPAHKPETIKSVSGAGDSFVASVVTNLHNLDRASSSSSEPTGSSIANYDTLWNKLVQIIHDGQTAAILTMQTYETVSPSLTQSPQALRLVSIKK
ncbi:Ribokinase-like protein [Mortierella sp. GBAus27b]|nr:Ribokinase-like protein [Mortierella sp. GBAus27b]